MVFGYIISLNSTIMGCVYVCVSALVLFLLLWWEVWKRRRGAKRKTKAGLIAIIKPVYESVLGPYHQAPASSPSLCIAPFYSYQAGTTISCPLKYKPVAKLDLPKDYTIVVPNGLNYSKDLWCLPCLSPTFKEWGFILRQHCGAVINTVTSQQNQKGEWMKYFI